MRKYFYSATTNSFYPVLLIDDYKKEGSWPDDAVEVDDSLYAEFAACIPPDGKVRVVNNEGFPQWCEPVFTSGELIEMAVFTKNKLLSDSLLSIAPLQDAEDLGIATEEEMLSLVEWKKYRVQLNRVDVTLASDILWPAIPA